MKMKLSPIALIALSILSLATLGKIAFVIADLYFLNEPMFYKLHTCPSEDLRINVLWSTMIANLTILASAYLIYRLFSKVVVQAVWRKKDSLRLTGLFFAASVGFFLAKLGELIANDFLMKPSEIGCPLFSSTISSYYLKAAIANLLFDPLFMMVVLLMALISAFLRYSYGLKEENDSFI